jgi:hypothetical protein
VGVGTATERLLVWSGVGVVGMRDSLKAPKRFQNRTMRVAVPVTWCQSEAALGQRTMDSGWWTVDGGVGKPVRVIYDHWWGRRSQNGSKKMLPLIGDDSVLYSKESTHLVVCVVKSLGSEPTTVWSAWDRNPLLSVTVYAWNRHPPCFGEPQKLVLVCFS